VFIEQQLPLRLLQRLMQHMDMLGWHTTMSFNRTTTPHHSLLQTWLATLDMSMLILRAHKSTTHKQLHLQHCHLSISPWSLLMPDRQKNIKQNCASDRGLVNSGMLQILQA
jgi:hypothetical protein